jgi:hypothetical protein
LHQRGHTALTAGSLASDLGRLDGSGLELMRRRRARRAVTGIAPSGFGRDEDIRAMSRQVAS